MTSGTAAAIAALIAGTGVALGAFGAHTLRASMSPRDLEIFEVAMRYQMYHALALFISAGFIDRGVKQASNAAWAFLAGIVIFSGSLYAMILTDARWLGAITPIGGVAFIAGWCILALSARRL